MKKLLPALLCLFAAFSFLLNGADKVSPENWTAEDFLMRVRNPPGRDSWASMKGTAQHRREGARPVKASIEMGIFFTPVRVGF